MVFSENQVRHLYVQVGNPKSGSAVAASDANGTIRPQVKNGNLYFEYKGVGADGLTRSDIIPVANIISAKATDASKMQMKLKATKVALNANVIAGQDYILKIAIRQAFGTSDQDIYFKYGMVHGKANMTKSEFYIKLIESLNKNFSRENTTWFVFKGIQADDHSLVDNPTLANYDETTTTKTLEGIAICEVEQEWKLGVKPLVPVYFDVMPDTILVSGDETVWGTVSDVTSTYNQTVNNGKITADLEYFCMGERGDIYRNVGFPHVINTEYLVAPASAYYYLDIHYAYVGANEGVQKSEKTITIVCSTKGADNASSTGLNALINAINTAAGTSIARLA